MTRIREQECSFIETKLGAAKERSEIVCFGTTDGGTFEAKITAITHMPGRIGNVGIRAKNGEKEYQGWYNYNTHRGVLAP